MNITIPDIHEVPITSQNNDEAPLIWGPFFVFLIIKDNFNMSILGNNNAGLCIPITDEYLRESGFESHYWSFDPDGTPYDYVMETVTLNCAIWLMDRRNTFVYRWRPNEKDRVHNRKMGLPDVKDGDSYEALINNEFLLDYVASIFNAQYNQKNVDPKAINEMRNGLFRFTKVTVVSGPQNEDSFYADNELPMSVAVTSKSTKNNVSSEITTRILANAYKAAHFKNESDKKIRDKQNQNKLRSRYVGRR